MAAANSHQPLWLRGLTLIGDLRESGANVRWSHKTRPAAGTLWSPGSPVRTLAQPFGGDPLSAGGDGQAGMQRTLVAVFIGEVDGRTLARAHGHAGAREMRAAAALGRVQVHDEAGDAFAAGIGQGLVAGLGRIEPVVVRLVLLAGAVVQYLQAFAVDRREVDDFGDAVLEAGDQFGFAQLEEHAAAGACAADLVSAGVGRSDEHTSEL